MGSKIRVKRKKKKPMSPTKASRAYEKNLGEWVKVETAHTTYVHRSDGTIGEAPYTVKRAGRIKKHRGRALFFEYGKRKPYSWLTNIVGVEAWNRRKRRRK